jgi:hypothetical protein
LPTTYASRREDHQHYGFRFGHGARRWGRRQAAAELQLPDEEVGYVRELGSDSE